MLNVDESIWEKIIYVIIISICAACQAPKIVCYIKKQIDELKKLNNQR